MTTTNERAAVAAAISLVRALLVILALACLGSAPALARDFNLSQYTYVTDGFLSGLDTLSKRTPRSAEDLAADLAKVEALGNPRNTAIVVEQLLSKRPTDASLAEKLAGLLLIAEPLNDQDRYEIPPKILGAAMIAYKAATTKEAEARTLAILARALMKREEWRPALIAFKQSLALKADEQVQAEYEDLRAEQGFRVTDYSVESDAVQPRVCFAFSEALDRSVSDFKPYFTQEPGPVSAVTVDGSKLCVENLKHGQRYQIAVRQGLPSAVDEPLSQDGDYDIYVRDRAPSVRFVGRNYVLPRTGQTGIPIVTVNSREVDLVVRRIGDRSITSIIGGQFQERLYGDNTYSIDETSGQVVWRGSVETAFDPNQDVTTAVPVAEALKTLQPGVYVMTAVPKEAPQTDPYDQVETQWFVVSDLGLATMKGKDGLNVQLRSIASADPIADATIRVLAKNNEVLGTTKTDAKGQATIEPGLLKGSGGTAPVMVTAEKGDDYVFLDLTQTAFDLTDRGVEGREPGGAVDAFVYTERGVYRRGETVHVAALLRDENANALPAAPLTLIVKRPDGVEYSRATLADGGAGGRSTAIDIIPGASSGTWRIDAYTDPSNDPVGSTTFMVEDYVPDRIEFDLVAKSAAVSATDGAILAVDGRYLFGAPAAGLDLEGDANIGLDEAPYEQWKGYVFGLSDEKVEATQNSLDSLPQTDANGKAEFPVLPGALPATTRPLKMDAAIRMREPGGRAVEERVSLPIRPTGPLLGLKPGFDETGVKEGQAAAFDIIAIDPDGTPRAAAGTKWTLSRLSRNWQWYLSDGSWNYEATTTASVLTQGALDIAAGNASKLSLPVEWGEYRLEVATNGFTSASMDFSVGYYGESRSDAPDTVPLALDKTSVKSGETLNLRIESRFAGKASVSVLGDRLLSSTLIDVPEGGTSVAIPVGQNWGTGAYAIVHLLRPLDVAAKRLPSRSIGVAWFGIDREARALKVTLGAQTLVKPRNELPVPIKVEGLAPGEKAYVTVSAVDVGILNLTNYQSPAPDAYYLDQKRLSAELRDLYGQLIDGMQGARGKLRTGGDGASAELSGSPPAQAPLAQFSGIVEVAADGTATTSFTIPAFNGTIRLMAVAWTASKVGHGTLDVVTRDPVVIAGTLPRFISAGDQSRFRLDLLNAEAPAGDYTLALSIDGPIEAQPAALYQTVTLGPTGSRTPVDIPIKGTGVGPATLIATLAGPGGVDIDQTYIIGVTPTNPIVTRRTVQKLPRAGGAVTVSNDLLAEMLPGTGAVTLSVGPLTDLDVAGLLKELDRYPYGCSEQLVSRALPLLYLSDLGGDSLGLTDGVKERLQQTVAQLLSRQDSAGGFGLWDSYSGDLWLASYVTDFMLRAREKGFAVPEGNLTLAVDYLKNRVGNAPEFDEGQGEDVAYALYTLARAGRAPAGDLKYFADTKIETFGTALARAQIGAALGLIGDKPRAEKAMASAIDGLSSASAEGERTSRSDYGSTLRDAAAIIALSGDADLSRFVEPASQVLTKERAKSRYTSTQEMVWMVLAARAAANEAKTMAIDAGGIPQKGAYYRVFRDGALASPFTVKNTGSADYSAVVSVSGSPLVAEPASASDGMFVQRDYFNQDGTPADPRGVKQNTRLVVVLTGGPVDNSAAGNYLLVDRLPAGFEIENPSLIGSGSTNTLPWLSGLSSVTYNEFRDDRFVAAFSNQSVKVAYMIRAVAPGTYIHPGAFVEDMYNPSRNARGETATTVVTAGGK